jgi:poly(A)-specific ribonuclease
VVADTDGISDPRAAETSWDTIIPVLAKEEGEEAKTDWGHREIGTVMPDFSSGFWKVYGNKLRVFGTLEGVAILDGSG